MPSDTPSEPITVRIRKQTVSEIDALAASMDRSRNYIVNEAIRHYLDANRWQIERIKEGVAAARAGQVKPAEQVYAEIAAKFGWKR